MNDQTICVIGSNSFSGASFCKSLLMQGYQVIAISRSEEPVPALLPYSWIGNVASQLQFYQFDINHQLPSIESLLDKTRTGIVINFAAQSMVGQSWEFPEHWFQTNAVATIKLHNMLRHKDYLEKYVHVTTPEVYGNCEGFVSEDHIYNPSTPYAVSRAAADMSLKTFFEVHKFPVLSTRAANVYGEGQQLYRIIPKTIMSILGGKKLPLHGGGHSKRSFIHIDDVSAATLDIALQGKLGECYHISTNNIISIRELVEKICISLDVDFHEVCEVTQDRPGKDAAYQLDSGKLRKALNWEDKISLDDGICRTVGWARKNYSELAQQPLNYIHKV